MKRGHYALFHKTVIRNLAGEVYLVRWRIFQTPILSLYLHRILRSDDDRALHDHPWSFISLILSGGYFEHTPDGRRWFGPGAIVAHHAEDLHRLELAPSPTMASGATPALTLVLCGPRRRLWGFSTGGRWQESSEYLAVSAVSSDETIDRPCRRRSTAIRALQRAAAWAH